jgi:Fe-S cluster assembly protein SufD
MDLPVQQFRTKAEQGFLDIFAEVEKKLPGNNWATKLRRKAIQTFGSLGLPTRRIEAWKYTDLRTRLTDAFPPALGSHVGKAARAGVLGSAAAKLPAYRIVIVGGSLQSELSDLTALRAEGVEILSLAEALQNPPSWLMDHLGKINPQNDDAVIALNLALMTGGIALKLGKGATLNKPIHLIHVADNREPASSFTRNLIVVEEGASLDLLESYASLGSAPSLGSTVTEALIADNASLDHVKLQAEHPDTTHLSAWLIGLKRDARYNGFQFSTGAALSRNQINAGFDGEGSAVNISGAFLMRGKQHCDTTLLVEHRVPRCSSRELFKVVLDDEARGIFQGKIIVSPNAQKTDGKQMAGALLLSETAEFDSKPELEIFADDVVCGHGSTSGQIDEDLLFYLESRGIPADEARALLIQAFVGEAVELIENEGLRNVLTQASADWLGVKLQEISLAS